MMMARFLLKLAICASMKRIGSPRVALLTSSDMDKCVKCLLCFTEWRVLKRQTIVLYDTIQPPVICQ